MYRIDEIYWWFYKIKKQFHNYECSFIYCMEGRGNKSMYTSFMEGGTAFNLSYSICSFRRCGSNVGWHRNTLNISSICSYLCLDHCHRRQVEWSDHQRRTFDRLDHWHTKERLVRQLHTFVLHQGGSTATYARSIERQDCGGIPSPHLSSPWQM